MRAVLSGRAAVALLNEGDVWQSMTYEAPEQLTPCHAAEAEVLLRNVHDLIWLDDVSIDEVRDRLADVVDTAEALDCVLYLLDGSLQPVTRDAVALEFEELAIWPEIVEQVESVLLASPLPSSADMIGAIDACTRTESSAAAKLFRQWQSLQSIVVAVFNAWLQIPLDKFGDTQQRTAIHGHLINYGVFATLVRSGLDASAVSATQLSLCSNSQFKRDVPNAVRITSAWVRLLGDVGWAAKSMPFGEFAAPPILLHLPSVRIKSGPFAHYVHLNLYHNRAYYFALELPSNTYGKSVRTQVLKFPTAIDLSAALQHIPNIAFTSLMIRAISAAALQRELLDPKPAAQRKLFLAHGLQVGNRSNYHIFDHVEVTGPTASFMSDNQGVMVSFLRDEIVFCSDELVFDEAVGDVSGKSIGETASFAPWRISVFGLRGPGNRTAFQRLGASAANEMSFKFVEPSLRLAEYSAADLELASNRIFDTMLEGNLPIVFFDELNAMIPQSDDFGLKKWLGPILNVQFRNHDARVIRILGGGASTSNETFVPPDLVVSEQSCFSVGLGLPPTIGGPLIRQHPLTVEKGKVQKTFWGRIRDMFGF